jgi:gamma-glutamyltranspeptidase/glutathione hydrolase
MASRRRGRHHPATRAWPDLAGYRQDGRDAFYKGAVAEDMVETLRGIGGLHTLDDFARHTTETTTSDGTSYRATSSAVPPNGPGLTMLVMLNILSRFDLSAFAPIERGEIHLEAEAARIAYMVREQHIGDPAHVEIDVAKILSPAFVEDYASQIRMDRVLDLPVVTPPLNPSTIYITVVDKDRNVCSFINSIAHSFGRRSRRTRRACLLQNRAAGFRVQPVIPIASHPASGRFTPSFPRLSRNRAGRRCRFGVMGGQYQPWARSMC